MSPATKMVLVAVSIAILGAAGGAGVMYRQPVTVPAVVFQLAAVTENQFCFTNGGVKKLVMTRAFRDADDYTFVCNNDANFHHVPFLFGEPPPPAQSTMPAEKPAQHSSNTVKRPIETSAIVVSSGTMQDTAWLSRVWKSR